MGYGRRLAALVVVLAALLTGFTATSAFAAKHMEVAVQDDNVLFAGFYSTPQVDLALAQRLHTSRVRVNAVWAYVVGRKDAAKKTAPKRIKYNWSGFDLLVANARPYGIKIQIVLTGPAPAWATGNHKIGVFKPKAGAFKAFAAAAADHFKGTIDRYSVWNEPNYRGWLAPSGSAPKLYRALYTAGYSAIKQANPDAKVFFGETAPYAHGRNAMAPLQFLRGVTCAKANYKRAHKCATLKTDGFAHHPYDFRHKPTYKYPGKDNVTVSTLGRLTSALSKLRRSKLLSTPSGGVPFLYLTEYGYFSSGKYKLPSAKQGKYLAQGFQIAQRNPRVKQMLQFLLLKPGGNFSNFDTSIVSRSGKPSRAFKMLEAWTKKAAKTGKIAVPRKP